MTKTHASNVRDYVRSHAGEVIADLDRLVRLETPSDRPDLLDAGLTEIQRYLIERLGEPVSRTRHDGGAYGDVLDLTWSGTYGGGTHGEDRALLSVAHYDTVWPQGTVATWPLTRDGDRLSGPGVLDMIGGIVQTVWMLKALRELAISHPPLRLLLTGDEEIGSVAGRPHIEAAAAESIATLIAEPSGSGDVKTQRKGTMFADVIVRGIESHAGLDPEKGASAVQEMAFLIPQITELADPARGTTINVGIVSGGTGRNVVAGHATCEVDIRIQDPDEADRIARGLHGLSVTDPRCTVEVKTDLNRPPMNPNEHTDTLLALVAEVAHDLGENIGAQAVGGASDGNFVAALGFGVLDGLGGIGAGPHARHEHITISGFFRQTALMAGIAERLGRSAAEQR